MSFKKSPLGFPGRAGAGGEEAGIWAGDLLRMYQRYGSNQGWKTQLLSKTAAESGGYREVVLQVGHWVNWHAVYELQEPAVHRAAIFRLGNSVNEEHKAA